MKILTKEGLKNFKNEVLKNEQGANVMVGEALSNILLSSKTGGKMKCFILAQKLFTEPEVEVDESDLSLIKQAVEATEICNNIISGQLLVILENIKK